MMSSTSCPNSSARGCPIADLLGIIGLVVDPAATWAWHRGAQQGHQLQERIMDISPVKLHLGIVAERIMDISHEELYMGIGRARRPCG